MFLHLKGLLSGRKNIFPVPFRKPKRDQGAMMIQDDSGLNPWPTVNGSEIRPTSWVGYFNPIISDPGFIAS